MAVVTAGVCAELPRAAEIAELRAALAAAHRREDRMRLRGDLRWLEVDRAREIQSSISALEIALELADEGDPDAARALELADRLDYAETPSSFSRPNHANEPGPGNLEVGEFRRNLAQCRRQGIAFDTAWTRSIGLVKPADAPALQWSRPAWQSAYYREPAPDGYALSGWE